MDVFLTPECLARRWGIDSATLRTMRHQGRGPNYTKITGKIVRYNLEDIEQFEKERKHEIDESRNS